MTRDSTLPMFPCAAATSFIGKPPCRAMLPKYLNPPESDRRIFQSAKPVSTHKLRRDCVQSSCGAPSDPTIGSQVHPEPSYSRRHHSAEYKTNRAGNHDRSEERRVGTE